MKTSNERQIRGKHILLFFASLLPSPTLKNEAEAQTIQRKGTGLLCNTIYTSKGTLFQGHIHILYWTITEKGLYSK